MHAAVTIESVFHCFTFILVWSTFHLDDRMPKAHSTTILACDSLYLKVIVLQVWISGEGQKTEDRRRWEEDAGE